MLSSDQERALERFSLECSGRRVTVRELSDGQAIFKSGGKTLLVQDDGTTTLLSGRRRRP